MVTSSQIWKVCWNKGRLCWKIAKLFYFCHLKKLVRPETFGPYHVHYTVQKVHCLSGNFVLFVGLLQQHNPGVKRGLPMSKSWVHVRAIVWHKVNCELILEQWKSETFVKRFSETCEKARVNYVMSVRPSAWEKSAFCGWIFVVSYSECLY